MSASKALSATNKNIFLRMHPVHRLLAGMVLSLVTYFLCKNKLQSSTLIVLLWLVFSVSYLLFNGVVLFTRTVQQIRVHANRDDGSKTFVFTMILLSSFASLVSILMLMLSGDFSQNHVLPGLAVMGMMSSWTMVHTQFTFHYAHMYYSNLKDDNSKLVQGLEFPGDEKPDYIDFAYFSFIIGCTFQVSDVSISSRKIRRMALLHGLLSFLLNTFVVALTINLIAGLLNT